MISYIIDFAYFYLSVLGFFMVLAVLMQPRATFNDLVTNLKSDDRSGKVAGILMLGVPFMLLAIFHGAYLRFWG